MQQHPFSLDKWAHFFLALFGGLAVRLPNIAGFLNWPKWVLVVVFAFLAWLYEAVTAWLHRRPLVSWFHTTDTAYDLFWGLLGFSIGLVFTPFYWFEPWLALLIGIISYFKSPRR